MKRQVGQGLLDTILEDCASDFLEKSDVYKRQILWPVTSSSLLQINTMRTFSHMKDKSFPV